MPKPGSPTSPRRVRRTQDEVHELLLKAARERFAAYGYARTSLRALAADAGASTTLIFSYYGSKAGLFEAAVLEPFGRFIEQSEERLRTSRAEGATLLDEVAAYVRGLYRLFRQHRTLVLALLTSDAVGDDTVDSKVDEMLSRLLKPFDAFGQTELGRSLAEGLDVPLATRATLGMIIAMTLDDGTRSDEDELNEDYIVDQLSRLLTFGYVGSR